MSFRMSAKVDPAGAILVYDKKKLRAVMRGAGAEVAAAARKLIRQGAAGGKVYRGSGGSEYRPYRAGKHVASAPGQAPVNLTGTLAKSIRPKVAPSGQYVRVVAAFYGLFLEHGAQGGAGSGKKGVKGRANARANGVRGKGRGALLATAGSRKLEPRPFLSAALGAREASIGERIRESIAKDIAFRKMK